MYTITSFKCYRIYKSITKRYMHTQAIAVYLAITNFYLIAAVWWFVCKVNLQKETFNLHRYKIATGGQYFFKCGFFLHSIPVATAFVTINSKTSHVDNNPTFFMAYLFFYKIMKGFSQPFSKAFF